MKKFPYYYDLEPFLSGLPSVRPVYTKDVISNKQGDFNMEEDLLDDGVSSLQSSSSTFLKRERSPATDSQKRFKALRKGLKEGGMCQKKQVQVHRIQ